MYVDAATSRNPAPHIDIYQKEVIDLLPSQMGLL